MQMQKCIICGTEFENALLSAPNGGSKTLYFKKQICDSCASPTQKKATIRRYPDAPIDGYIRLAGVIECGVIREYKQLYYDAIKAMVKSPLICSEEEGKFLRLHQNLMQSAYHSALTLANTEELCICARREIQKEFKGLCDELYTSDVFSYMCRRYARYKEIKNGQR